MRRVAVLVAFLAVSGCATQAAWEKGGEIWRWGNEDACDFKVLDEGEPLALPPAAPIRKAHPELLRALERDARFRGDVLDGFYWQEGAQLGTHDVTAILLCRSRHGPYALVRGRDGWERHEVAGVYYRQRSVAKDALALGARLGLSLGGLVVDAVLVASLVAPYGVLAVVAALGGPRGPW